MSLDEITTKYQQVCAKAVEATIRQVAAKHDINELVDQTPWTTIEALMEDGNVPYQGQDPGFI